MVLTQKAFNLILIMLGQISIHESLYNLLTIIWFLLYSQSVLVYKTTLFNFPKFLKVNYLILHFIFIIPL